MKKRLFIVISIGLVALIFLLVYRINLYDKYHFGDNSVFRYVESDGLVDEMNYTVTTDECSITVDAFFCDQINTYVKLSAKGDSLFKNNEESIDGHIEYAVLTDTYGNTWTYDELVGRVSNGDLGLNETVLEFQGGPSKNCTVNLQIKLDIIDEPVLFSDMKISVVEANVIDLEEENYYISVPYAKGKITTIVYTPLKTQILVDWDYENIDDFCDSYINFVGNHTMKICTESDEYEVMIFPHNPTGIPEKKSKYNVYHSINPDEELKIDLFAFDEEESSMVFSKRLLSIPPVSESGKNE